MMSEPCRAQVRNRRASSGLGEAESGGEGFVGLRRGARDPRRAQGRQREKRTKKEKRKEDGGD